MWLHAAVLLACTVCVAVAGASATRPNAPAVRVRVLQFVDRSRTVLLPDGRRQPRTLETIVRYPTSAGRHPLIVFGHGFGLTPAPYSPLLQAWSAAGYVVAAPVFPLGNANAPGGPNESDIVNQPGDMSFVITKLLALNRLRTSVLGGEIDPSRIAIAGHSDGAVTALAVAYGSRYRDPRVRAAIILSGATLRGMGAFSRDGPPLLATQGTADPINPPALASTIFGLAGRPKFLLWLIGASHRPPYTYEQPQLGIVERATIAFLGHYLEGKPLAVFEHAARRSGLTQLVARP